ncbi:hypothetical protein [Deinococcus multiflagellatus]|uniref:Lipoprotein n=1 Tax=Deinococcus multiflagellatus TaxID=1656887 RepID=A0ABW1ZLI9_9DEIO
MTAGRAAALAALQRHRPSEAALNRCGVWSPDTKTARLAFPAGRSNLVLLEMDGRAFAFRTPGNGTAQLLWCGAFVQPGQQASALSGSAARALAFSYRTGQGTFPRETAPFDTYTELAQQLTVTAGPLQHGRRCTHTYNLTGYGLSFPSADLLRFTCDGQTVVGPPRR